jgi:hypothetical protein
MNTCSGFFSLPLELRDEIYRLCLEYPDIRYLLDEHLEKTREALSTRFRTEVSVDTIDRLLEWTSIEVPQRPALRCPALFLLNRQVSHEAQCILHTKWLRIDTPISSIFSRDVRGLHITDFIGDRALSSVRYASLVLNFDDLREANNWYRTITQLWNIWSRRNSLKRLEIHIHANSGIERDHQIAITRKLVIAKVSFCARIFFTWS